MLILFQLIERFYAICFIGVLAMLELKPNELLVGSGDGSVSLVLDKSGQAAHQKRKSDGITRQLNEPTTSCLQEVISPSFSMIIKYYWKCFTVCHIFPLFKTHPSYSKNSKPDINWQHSTLHLRNNFK